MDKASFEKLIADQPQEVKAKGVTLFNGVLVGMTTYGKEKTALSLKNWQASEAALAEFINSLNAKPVNEKTFNSISAVVNYLKVQGWKISLRTGYNHRDQKKILPRSDGKYYQSDVDRYANSGEIQRLDGIKPEVSDNDLERKKKAEADSAEYDARIKRIRAEAIEGKYVDRDVFEDELSAQALAFRNSIQTYVHAHAEEIVSFVGGDVSKIPDLTEFMLTRADEHFVKCAEQIERAGLLINHAGDELNDPGEDSGEEDE